ncbi:MAG: glycosyltransferase family 4 protein [Spirochaetota bacterium]
MRILVFEQRYTNPKEAGFARFSLFSRYWTQEGHEVYVVSGMINYILGRKPEEYKGKMFIKQEERRGLTVYRVWESNIGYFTFIGRLCSYFSFLISAFVAGLLLPKPDVIIASSPPIFVGLLGYAVSFFRRSAFIFEARDIWPDAAIKLKVLKNKILIKMSYALEKFIYKNADFIVVNSPGIKEFLMENKSIASSKIGVAPNPMDLELFEYIYSKKEARREFSLPEDKFIFLYSGAMAAVYDFDTLLEAAKDLKNLPVYFVLAGGGRQKNKLAKKIRSEKIENVLMIDSVSKEKLPVLLAAVDAGIATLSKMPLLKYVYATKIFDYMAAGKPIVIAMEGVSRELVCEKARCGVCVEPENKNALKRAIIEIYEDKSFREEMGKRGFEHLQKNFNPEKIGKSYLDYIIQANNRTKGIK